MSIIILDYQFKNKTGLTNFTRELVNSLDIGPIVARHDFFMELFKRHYFWKDHLGEIKSFRIDKNVYQKKYINIVTNDDYLIESSWVRACSMKEKEEKEFGTV